MSLWDRKLTHFDRNELNVDVRGDELVLQLANARLKRMQLGPQRLEEVVGEFCICGLSVLLVNEVQEAVPRMLKFRPPRLKEIVLEGEILSAVTVVRDFNRASIWARVLHVAWRNSHREGGLVDSPPGDLIDGEGNR